MGDIISEMKLKLVPVLQFSMFIWAHLLLELIKSQREQSSGNQCQLIFSLSQTDS